MALPTYLPTTSPVYCPIPSAINPAVNQIEAEAIAWIDRMGFYEDQARRERIIGTRAAEFFSRLAPDADPERVLLAAEWVYWGFTYDDVFCDSPGTDPVLCSTAANIICRAVEVPTDYSSGSDVLQRHCRALQDIARRTSRMATPVQMQRLVAAHRAWTLATTWHVAVRASGQRFSVDDYLTMRLPDCGGHPTFAWLEICSALEVPAAEMDAAAVRAATEMATVAAALDNDRHSIRAERTGGYSRINMHTVLIDAGYAPIEAASHAAALHDHILDRFLRLHKRLTPTASPALHAYLNGLRHGIRGNAEWGQRVPRYMAGDATPQLRWAKEPTPPPGGELLRPTTLAWWDTVDQPLLDDSKQSG